MILIPTLHPAAILRGGDDGDATTAKFEKAVIADLIMARELRSRRPSWNESVIWERKGTRLWRLFPTLQEVVQFCRQVYESGDTLIIDVESTGAEPMDCQLICIGMATQRSRQALCLPIYSQGGVPYWTQDQLREVYRHVGFLFASTRVPKCFHNGPFDCVVLAMHGLPIVRYEHDTMQAHHTADGELPQNLGYVSSRTLELPYWKDEVKGDHRWLDLPDMRLRSYNLRDCLATADSLMPLLGQLREYELYPLYWEEIECNKIMIKATLRGLEIDTHRRDDTTLDEKGIPKGLGPRLRLQREKSLAILHEIAGSSSFNPRSPKHLQFFLYDLLKFPVVLRTKTKQPSTDKNAMVLLALNADHPDQKAALRALIEYRQADKMIGTWVEGLRILGDGRIHPSWKLLTVTGRFSSSPNSQNWNKYIKRIVRAGKGNKFVSIDLSQAEMRVMAYLSGDPELTRMYEQDINVHTVAASLLFHVKCPPEVTDNTNPQTEAYLREITSRVFGLNYDDFPVMAKKQWKPTRTLSKNFGFGHNYGAEGSTLYETIRSKRDPDTNDLLFPDVTLAEIEALKLQREKIHPAIPKWWKTICQTIQKQGYYQCPVSGRRRWFRAGFKRTEMLNCVDADTEALTQRGWVPGFELERSDVLLTKNATTGKLEWQKMTDLKLFPADGTPRKLIEFKSKSFHAISTPDHRWLVTTNSGDVQCRVSSEIRFNGVDRIHRTGDYVGSAKQYFSDDFVGLAGWFLTDGAFSTLRRLRTPDRPCVRLYQSARANPQKVEKIDALISRLRASGELSESATHHVCRAGPAKRTMMITWDLPPMISAQLNILFPQRELTPDFLSHLTRRQCDLLLDTMIDGDGCRSGGKTTFVSRSEDQAHYFQMLALLCGYASTIRKRDMRKYTPRSTKLTNVPRGTEHWQVTLLRREHVHLLEHQKREYEANVGVWCPIVPNTYFVARRSGHVFVTGNTPIQTWVASWMNRQMIKLARELETHTKDRTWIALQVHDALTTEGPDEDVEITKKIFADVFSEDMSIDGIGTVRLPADPATVGTHLDEV